jgi:hypothetical protein
MQESLWVFNPKRDATGQRVYSELNTGDFWCLGDNYVRERVRGLPPDVYSDRLDHFLSPVILFIDGTLADRLGRLKVEPVLCSIGNINGKQRGSADAWFILGFIPPYPKSSKEAEADSNKKETKHLKAKYYHECISSILQDLLVTDNNVLGHKVFVPGYGYRYVHFKLSLIIGDTEGHDKACAHYCSYSSNIQRMSRDCNIPQKEANNVQYDCTFVNAAHIKAEVSQCIEILENGQHGTIGPAEARLQKISQLPVESAFFKFDFCGCPHGVFASCPFERLHAFLTGIMKDGMEKLFLMSKLPEGFVYWYFEGMPENDARGKMKFNVTDSDLHINKAKFEGIFRFLTMCARRQSDRQMPRMPFKNGVTDLTRLNGQEYPGLVFLTLVTIKPLLHESTMHPEWHGSIIRVLWMMLSLNEMMSLEAVTTSDLQLLDRRVETFLQKFKGLFEIFALANSKVGLKKVKFHAPKHATRYIKRYGSSTNYFGGTLESCLKPTVKWPSELTSRRQDFLLKELAQRQQERFAVAESKKNNDPIWQEFQSFNEKELPKKRARSDLDDSASLLTDKPDEWKMELPKFSLSFHANEWSTHHRKYTHRNQIVYPDYNSTRSDSVYSHGQQGDWVLCLADYAKDQNFRLIECSLCCKIPSAKDGASADILHCRPSYRSYPYLRRSWHDWAMVRWRIGRRRTEQLMPARILMLAKLSNNANPLVNARFVAVVHPWAGASLSHDDMLFFAHGGKLDDDFLVVEATMIEGTAFVLPSIEKAGDRIPASWEEAEYFLSFPPRHTWKDIGW